MTIKPNPLPPYQFPNDGLAIMDYSATCDVCGAQRVTVNEKAQCAHCAQVAQAATIAGWLRAIFGESANAIDGINDHWISNNPFTGVSFCATRGTGDLQITCGGDCLVAFDGVNGKNIRGTVFLIRDDNAGRAWEAEQYNQPETYCQACDRKHRIYPPTRPRPAAKLRLVMSA